MRILIIDNYDSFTFNLKHDLERVEGVHAEVLRNDELKGVTFSQYDRIVLSPGPGLPHESGQLLDTLAQIKSLKIPVLGVCLGLQAMVVMEGGELYNLGTVRHGVAYPSNVDTSDNLYAHLESNQLFGLYHSWAAKGPLNESWKVTAESEEGIIMSIRHSELPWVGVQYHPESVLTDNGRVILKNWLEENYS